MDFENSYTKSTSKVFSKTMDPSGFGENWSVSLKSLKKIYRLMKSFFVLAIWNASCTWSSKFGKDFRHKISESLLLYFKSDGLKTIPIPTYWKILKTNCIFLADLNLILVMFKNLYVRHESLQRHEVSSSGTKAVVSNSLNNL